ncbi:MAG: hypothetical protein JWP88_2227 [Flaviaesturariibacter sp.]|nr:hypothetical protein [Flaviaesturariibacter sp.]
MTKEGYIDIAAQERYGSDSRFLLPTLGNSYGKTL